ncbi:hypothetical protein HPB52_023806 [Rhipicephalus sanguineus]|uniref:Uncharacterized protein n=1 Tax=Rhipicephalus sanguineus TaxID=34632 RepID=A0A9D4SWV2_RHISA|nr:hypothetical protein HPB52_023806 [Rhipicephalus sanguineus]
MSKSIENLSGTVTRLVTSNIKTWLHGTNPRSRMASPFKDVNRLSKLSHAIHFPEISEDSELLLAQGTDVGVDRLKAVKAELAAQNAELETFMTDQQVAEDYDSVMEYDDAATNALALLEHHMGKLKVPSPTSTAHPAATNVTRLQPLLGTHQLPQRGNRRDLNLSLVQDCPS